MGEILKLFSDQSFISSKGWYEPILYPFWGKPVVSEVLPFRGYYPWPNSFDRFIEIADTLFEFSSPDTADLLVVPNNWNNWDGTKKKFVHTLATEKNRPSIQFCERYESFGKPFVSFCGGDFSHYKLPVPCDLIFRQSLYQQSRTQADFAMPAWGEDFIKTQLNGQLSVRRKSSKPVVGFCGFVPPYTFKTQLKTVASRLEKLILNPVSSRFNVGHLIRMKGISYLANSPRVTTNFLIQETPFFNLHNLQKQQPKRSIFMQNLLDSDYILCCRGAGNFSFRFYEALSSGRIPVFINTDCVLPYDFTIDWKSYCVWLEENELHLIDHKIAEFHEKLSPQDFIDLQYECRNLWEKWCSPEGFFSNLYRHLEQI